MANPSTLSNAARAYFLSSFAADLVSDLYGAAPLGTVFRHRAAALRVAAHRVAANEIDDLEATDAVPDEV